MMHGCFSPPTEERQLLLPPPTPHTRHSLFPALLLFYLLHQIYARRSSGGAKPTQTTSKADGQGEGQQTHYPLLINGVLTQPIPLLHYTEANRVASAASSPTSPICTTQGGGRGSERHNDIKLYLLALSKLLPSCHSETHFITNSRSGWRAWPGLKLGLLCIKTQLYGLHLVLTVGAGVWRLKDRWE